MDQIYFFEWNKMERDPRNVKENLSKSKLEHKPKRGKIQKYLANEGDTGEGSSYL